MSLTRVSGVLVETVYIALTVLGTGAVIALFSVLVGTRLDRWGDVHGVTRPRRFRRISPARSAVGLGVLIMGASVGTVGLLVGGAWIAAGVFVIVGSLVGGIVILMTGATRPPPPPPSDLPARYDGLAYLWHCRLPAFALDGNRILGAAVTGPPITVVLLVFGKWWGALAFGVLSILAWWAVLKAPVKTVPTRGPCLRAE